jgi:hypothetical protein
MSYTIIGKVKLQKMIAFFENGVIKNIPARCLYTPGGDHEKIFYFYLKSFGILCSLFSLNNFFISSAVIKSTYFLKQIL